jgi:hypothetical protein
MARFLRIGWLHVFDTTRILDINKGKTLLLKRPAIWILRYDSYESDYNSVKPNYYWSRVTFKTTDDRDMMFEKIKQYVPENVDNTLSVKDI